MDNSMSGTAGEESILASFLRPIYSQVRRRQISATAMNVTTKATFDDNPYHN